MICKANANNFFKSEILVLVLHFSKAPIKIAKISIDDFRTPKKFWSDYPSTSKSQLIAKMKLFGLHRGAY